MKIEAIEKTQSPTGRLRIRFCDGKSVMVYPAVIAELGLRPGMELDAEKLQGLSDRRAEVSARERAVRMVAARPVTEGELLHKLLAKGEQAEHAQKAVDRLKELHLLDDLETAKHIVRTGLARGYGKGRLRQLLYEKRVPKELWDKVLADLPEPDEKLQEFLQKRFRGSVPDATERRRATQALLRRGYTWEQVRRAMDAYDPAGAEDFCDGSYPDFGD